MSQSTLKLFFLQVTFFLLVYLTPASVGIISSVALERTRSMTLLFSTLQCISKNDKSNNGKIKEINSEFDPESHMHEYTNPKDVKMLIRFVKSREGERSDDPFTNSDLNIAQLNIILGAIYPNTDNFPLFYNTSVWMLNRVNSAQLFFALRLTVGEKYPKTVLTPSAVEVFPQFYINKKKVAKAAGVTVPDYSYNGSHPLLYYIGDPGLNEFHLHWHIDNPFWWNATKYGVERDRKGELFLYLHHQIVTRYQAELLSNGLSDVSPLELDPDYNPPESYYPDTLNVNYKNFPRRRKNETLREMDDGVFLKDIRVSYDRLVEGVEQGYFIKEDGSPESLQFENATDILGATFEAALTSANLEYYGNSHNGIHRLLGRVVNPPSPTATPGVMAHLETTLRDRIFYRLHKFVDNLYYKLKKKMAPYTRGDLEYPGVLIKSVEVHSTQQGTIRGRAAKLSSTFQIPILSTYFVWDKYDISTAARPCRGVGEEPTFVKVKTLDHAPFNYVISLKSTKSSIAYGMVRIFILPEFAHNGSRLDVDESHHRAIELDRFRIELEPNEELTITRSSKNSSITREARQPRIKPLYEWTASPGASGGKKKFRPKKTRACGWPRNLLIPKGTKDGLSFKLAVMVSEEQEPEKGMSSDFPNYPYCGALNGIPFPDSRPMGFPFDRPGTRFVSYDGIWAFLGGYEYKNVKQIPILIEHQEKQFFKT